MLRCFRKWRAEELTAHMWKWLFVTTVVSQGSVATRLRCGGQCDRKFVANLLTNSTVKKFRKSVNICQSYGQKYRGPFFDSQCRFLANVNFDGKSGSEILLSASVSNSLQIDTLHRVSEKKQAKSFFWQSKLFQDLILSLCVILGANPSYGHLTVFKIQNGCGHIRNLLTMFIFVIWSSLLSEYGCSSKIS